MNAFSLREKMDLVHGNILNAITARSIDESRLYASTLRHWAKLIDDYKKSRRGSGGGGGGGGEGQSSISDAEFETLLGRPIPDGHWSGTLDMNDAICQMYFAKSGLARFVYRRLTGMLNKSLEKGTPNLNLMFNYNMPFRAIAKMTGGICTMEMAQGILTVVNGHFFKGVGAVIGGFSRSGKLHKTAKKWE